VFERYFHRNGKKAKRSHNLNKFYNVLNELRNVLVKKDISELNMLHNKARDMYVSLFDEEKREIYNELWALHSQINLLVKEKRMGELKRQKELESKLENERRRIEQEKSQILLQKEKERQEKARKEAELNRKKGLERQEQRAAHARDGFYHAFDELKDALKNNDILKAKKLYIEARNIYLILPVKEKHEVYHKLLALHRHMSRLVEEKKRQEESKREKESKKQKELEKLDEEIKRKQEELAKQREAAEKAKETERHREEQRIKYIDQEKINLEESKKEKKLGIFNKLFKSKEKIIETKAAEEKAKEQKAPQTEFEELEDAIRNLGLFKKIEKEKIIKEKPGMFGKFLKK